MKIKRVKLKDGITTKDLANAGAVPVDGVMTILRYVEINNTEYCITIMVPLDIKSEDWNDMDWIDIIDTDGGINHYFKTFNVYQKTQEDIPESSKGLAKLVSEYNRILSEIPVLVNA